jgi:hypothetical protein
MAAITFAEAGEHETAREIIEKIDGNKKNYQKNKTDILYSQNK